MKFPKYLMSKTFTARGLLLLAGLFLMVAIVPAQKVPSANPAGSFPKASAAASSWAALYCRERICWCSMSVSRRSIPNRSILLIVRCAGVRRGRGRPISELPISPEIASQGSEAIRRYQQQQKARQGR